MPEALAWALGLIAFLIVLAISVGLHEGGHMGVAKLFKLDVPRFFVGFGPTVWSKKSSKTEYGIKAIPLGGFVQIEDRTQEEKAPERSLLSHVSPWKRILIFLAGPAVNIVLGVGILIIALTTIPVQVPTTQVKSTNVCVTADDPNAVTPACGASQVGILAGDKVISIDGSPVKQNGDLHSLLADKTTAVVQVERSGNTETFTVPLKNSKMGINLTTEPVYRDFKQATHTIGTIFALNIEGIANMPSKLPNVVESIFGAPRDPEAPSSIIHVGKTYGDVSADTTTSAPDKFQTLLLYSGLFNLGLGLINLLPIPPLDGGRIMIAVADSIKIAFSKVFRRKYNPVSNQTVAVLIAVSGVAVFGFMALLMLSDIVQITRGAL
jgi:membrane-associated protease RseP (regulator of RpoE activity)